MNVTETAWSEMVTTATLAVADATTKALATQYDINVYAQGQITPTSGTNAAPWLTYQIDSPFAPRLRLSIDHTDGETAWWLTLTESALTTDEPGARVTTKTDRILVVEDGMRMPWQPAFHAAVADWLEQGR